MIRAINRCLNEKLCEICYRAIQLDELSCKVKELLPYPLCDHCQVGSLNKGCLTLTTSTQWATELRYYLPELRDQLRKAGLPQLANFKISLLENIEPISCKSPPKTSLSLSAKQSLKAASERCTYPPLKAVLSRLAENQ